MRVILFLYAFLFACLFSAKASQPAPKQQNPKDCVKYPAVIKTASVVAQQAKLKTKTPEKEVTHSSASKVPNSVPYFSVFNFINFFYTKDTLDNLKVM